MRELINTLEKGACNRNSNLPSPELDLLVMVILSVRRAKDKLRFYLL